MCIFLPPRCLMAVLDEAPPNHLALSRKGARLPPPLWPTLEPLVVHLLPSLMAPPHPRNPATWLSSSSTSSLCREVAYHYIDVENSCSVLFNCCGKIAYYREVTYGCIKVAYNCTKVSYRCIEDVYFYSELPYQCIKVAYCCIKVVSRCNEGFSIDANLPTAIVKLLTSTTKVYRGRNLHSRVAKLHIFASKLPYTATKLPIVVLKFSIIALKSIC
jgi:hypothetical protein